jgi:hypothetical protein
MGRADTLCLTEVYYLPLESGSAPTSEGMWPSWSVFNTQEGAAIYKAHNPPAYQIFEIAAGFPCRAMFSVFHDYNPRTNARPAEPYVALSGFGLPARRVVTPGCTVWAPRALPVRVVWRGFLVDSLVSGAVWFGVLSIPLCRAQLRHSRGLCPKCAYDLRHDWASGCPECGWNRENPGGRWPHHGAR